MTEIEVIDVTDVDGKLLHPHWLVQAEKTHRQLRPQLESSYTTQMQRLFLQGARMCIAVVNNEVAGVAVWRSYENTANGKFVYVDDLVTSEQSRSLGVGTALLTHCREIARVLGCVVFSLDSGTQRTQAHKFYFRENMVVSAFHFMERL